MWEDGDPEYTVNYNGNADGVGNVRTDSATYFAGAEVTVSTQTPVRGGYTFVGWTTDAAGNESLYSAGSALTVEEENITLYAQWKAVDTKLPNTGGSEPTEEIPYTIPHTGVSDSGFRLIAGGSIVFGAILLSILRRRKKEQ